MIVIPRYNDIIEFLEILNIKAPSLIQFRFGAFYYANKEVLKMGVDKLTEKQKAFVKEYVIDFNGTQAAIRAGYSAKTANRIARDRKSVV